METSQTCPIDREKIKKSDLVGAPRVVLELLCELRVRCSECKVEMKREDYARHGTECEAKKRKDLNEEGGDGQSEKSASQQERHDEDTIECPDCLELVESMEVEVSDSSRTLCESQLIKAALCNSRTAKIAQLFRNPVAIVPSPFLPNRALPISSPPARSYQLPVLTRSSGVLISALAQHSHPTI